MTDAANPALATTVHRTVEWTLSGARERRDPWGEIAVFATMTDGSGSTLEVPAFWDGGTTWRVRVSAPKPGRWTLRSRCSDATDAGLHGQTATLVVEQGDPAEQNPLFRHGPVRVAASGRHFEHLDGTPFHWLADTWWMLLSERVSWPEGFARLTQKRLGQGFTVAQIVAGFPPDTTPFDGRDDNAGGSPWQPGYESINPGFFQAADRRLAHLVEAGIVPCILGGWGYHMMFAGKERTIAHWRYLVARYAAWPVVWCLAGEAAMAYYLSASKDADIAALQAAWPAVADAVKALDPWRRPLTLHPRRRSWDDTTDPEGLDFQMIQPGHLPNAPRLAQDSLEVGRARFADRIIVNAEPPYEGHGGTNLADVQRYSFWTSMLSGAAGFTYGAAGVFQANDRERPTGNRPDGGAFDAAFWNDAMEFPGAQQIADGHRLLVSLGAHRFEPHPEWAEIALRWGEEAYPLPVRAFAAGVPGEVRLIYLPLRWYHWDGPLVRNLEAGVRYTATYVEPDTFKRHELGIVTGDDSGNWRGPTLPHMFDWLLLMVRTG